MGSDKVMEEAVADFWISKLEPPEIQAESSSLTTIKCE